MQTDTEKKIAICCVADTKLKYLSQALRLLQSVRWFSKGLNASKVFIGYFEGTPDYYLEEYSRFNGTAVKLERYSSIHGPSNKMAILEKDFLKDFDYVMMIDCDTIIVDDFSEFLDFSGVQAKIADLKTLPERILSNVLTAAGKDGAVVAGYKTSIDRQETSLYCNSGVIIFSKEIFPSFVEKWFYWNNFLLERMDMLERYNFFL